MLQIRTIAVGMLDTNCYLVWLTEERFLYVVDPGADAGNILAQVGSHPFDDAAILLTHAHVDHILALAEVRRGLRGAPVYLNAGDEEMYRSPDNSLEPYISAAVDLPPTVSGLANAPGLRILPAPGHSRGGSMFYFPADGVLFSGDTLFAGSVGRTDLPGGDWRTLQKTIRDRILSLPKETRVYPGHGPSTTVERELAGNPYLAGLSRPGGDGTPPPESADCGT